MIPVVSVILAWSLSVLGKVCTKGSGFKWDGWPSSHAAVFAALFWSLWNIGADPSLLLTVFCFASAYLFDILFVRSRLQDYQIQLGHSFGDIVGGIVIGSATVWLVSKFNSES